MKTIPTIDEIKENIRSVRRTNKEYGECSGLRCELWFVPETMEFDMPEFQQGEWSPYLSQHGIEIDIHGYNPNTCKPLPISQLASKALKDIQKAVQADK